MRFLRVMEWAFGALLVYAAAVNALSPVRVLEPLRSVLGDQSLCAVSWPIAVMVALVLSQCWVGVSLLRFRGFRARSSVAGLAMASVLAWTGGGILQGAGDSVLQWSWFAAAVSAALLAFGPFAPRGQDPRPGIRRFLKGVTRAALALFVASIAGFTAVSQNFTASGKNFGSHDQPASANAAAPRVGQPLPR